MPLRSVAEAVCVFPGATTLLASHLSCPDGDERGYVPDRRCGRPAGTQWVMQGVVSSDYRRLGGHLDIGPSKQ